MKKILLLGDLILDVYHHGRALKLSSETPTIVGREHDTKITWGGGGCLARHILELGGELTFMTVIGDDHWGRLANDYDHPGVRKHFFVQEGRRSTVKERFWVDGYKLLQWDYLDNSVLDTHLEDQILSVIEDALPNHDLFVIADYRHGLISEQFAKRIMNAAQKYSIPVTIDSQVSQSDANHRWYAGGDLFCINEKEALSLHSDFSKENLSGSAEKLRSLLRAKQVIIKLGADGAAYHDGAVTELFAAHPIAPNDTTGAGDAFLAGFSVSEGSTGERMRQANIWAALSTTLLGTEPPSRSEFERILSQK